MPCDFGIGFMLQHHCSPYNYRTRKCHIRVPYAIAGHWRNTPSDKKRIGIMIIFLG